MSTRDLLERWRPSATPGAPSAAGVPADRVAERSAELEAVLAPLALVQAQATRIISDAAAEADRRREAAHAQGRAIVAEAHRQAQAERAAAASAAHAAGQASAGQIMSGARAQAQSIAHHARSRQADLVGTVLAGAREQIDAEIQAAT